MSRHDNIDTLGDNWKFLSDAEKAQIEESAKSDTELAADLEFAKSLSTMSASDLVGEPPTSDAVFLVNLREKLEPKTPVIRSTAWSGWRLWLSAATMSVLLCIAVFIGGEQSGGLQFAQSQDISADWYEGIEDLDELDEATIASYLDFNLEDDAELIDFDYESDEPFSDQLLELDNESIDEILIQIETITFFDNTEYANEG